MKLIPSFILFGVSLLSSETALARQTCTEVFYSGNTSKLSVGGKTYTISNSRSVRGWSYKGGTIASYVIFNGQVSQVIVEKFTPERGFERKLHTVKISNSDSILGWDWDEKTNRASYMFYDGQKTVVRVQDFFGDRFGGVRSTTTVSNSRLDKYSSSWTLYNGVAEYTLRQQTLKREEFSNGTFGSVLETISYNSGDSIAGRSCY
ncbi:MAG: hypothetical protein F6K23_18300 [Okeania sp. SIO2C9]|uniref:hypothetical protein n=1 Tax=Okeania sp. SIO2C9 TaxID=2607791 RepID=UPI0013C1AD3F|nr:hypothetical protein [Okeania sp. SIO2C9]NEQ74822.1 hypothetical protein [Okeania sp. SIO2C9]